ncbi:GNAT family N-acetyltransferase [Candidatus Entotheonella serta]|nr:GNAT family N-acetyltransferase [Candidatus Entotheonella serta]
MPTSQPTLHTDRLELRPPAPAYLPEIHRLIGAREVADTTLNIPHPYEDGMAEEWFKAQAERYDNGEGVHFSIFLRAEQSLIGGISLLLDARHQRGELGYWIGVPFWGQGYCTEAARAIVAYGFNTLDLNRIEAQHFTRNPASGRVMQKIGMTYEGCLRQHVRRWEWFEDLAVYGLLQQDFGHGQSEDRV